MNYVMSMDGSVVLRIFLEHDFSDTDSQCNGSETTWERHATLENVEVAFNQYCATHQLNAFLPRDLGIQEHKGNTKTTRGPKGVSISTQE